MKIHLEIIKENEDGSAEAIVEFDKEGLGVLVEAGLISMLEKYIKQKKKSIKKIGKNVQK